MALMSEKLQQLAETKNNKLDNLSNSKTVKLTNLATYKGYDPALSPQQNLSNAVDNQIFYDKDVPYQIDYQLDENGISQGQVKVPYTGQDQYGNLDTRDLYIDDTAQGNYKLGLARTDQGGYEGRYDTALHPDWETAANGQLAGVEGVTTKDGALMNITLPYNYATAFEYGVHTNPEQIKNRAMGIGPKTAETQARFGSGQTEYTTPNAPMWNSDYVPTEADLTQAAYVSDPKYHDNKKPSKDPLLDAVSKYGTVGGGYAPDYGPRWANPIKGAASTVIGAGYGTADAVSELAGFLTSGAIGGSIATPEEIETYANQITGHDPSYMENAGEEIKSAYRKFQKDGDWGDFLIDAGTAGLSVAGEAGATSLAFVATLYLPGKPLQAASKLGKLIKAETTGMKAAEKAAKTKELISNAKTVDKLIRIGQGQTGFIAVSMGETSADMDEYKKVYKEDMSPGRVMGSFGINLVKNNIDGFVDKGIITKSGIGSDTVRKLLSSAGDKEKVALAKELIARGFGVAADTILKEVPTEIIQAGMENVSAGYKEGEVGVGDVLTSQKTQEDMVVSAMMTPGSVGAMKAAGTAVSGAASVAGKGLKATEEVISSTKQPKPTESQIKSHTTIDKINTAASKADMSLMSQLLEKLDTIDTINDKVGMEKADNVRKTIAKRLEAEELKNVKDLRLGSEEEAISFIEEMYDYSENKESPTLLANMLKAGQEFGVTEDRIRTIKDSATVEAEATTGSRGYKTYDRSLTRLKKNPEAHSEMISKIEDQVLNFKATQEDRLDRVEKAVADVEANLKAGTQTSKKVKVPYAGGGAWTIHIKDGKIGESTYKNIEDIKRTVDGLQKVVDKHKIAAKIGSTNPYDVKGKFQVPEKMPVKMKGKGGSYEFVRNLKKEIKDKNTIITPIVSKRNKKHIVTINKLKKEGYVEVDKDGYVKSGTGRWVPQELSSVNEVVEKEKLVKKEKKEVAKEATRLTKKMSTDTTLTEDEQKFVDEHQAEVEQIKQQMDVVATLEVLDNDIAIQEDILKIADKTSNEYEMALVERDTLKDKREMLLKKRVAKKLISENLGKEFDKEIESLKKGVAGAKYIQPTNLAEYVQESPTINLLSSVRVEFFSNKVIQAARETTKTIKEILAPVDKTDVWKGANTTINNEMLRVVSSPARALIFDTDGNVNENVAVAIDAALTEYMAMGASNLGRKTMDDVARMLGNSNKRPTSEQYNFFKDLGNYRKNVADDIGKAVIRSLGLKANDNIPEVLYAKLVADVGNVAIQLGITNGVIAETKANLATHNKMAGIEDYEMMGSESLDGVKVSFIHFTKAGKDGLEIHKKKFDQYKEALKVEDNFTKGPHTTARKSDKNDIRNNDITVQPKKATKVLKVLREEKYIKQKGVVDWLVAEENEELVKFHMGYKTKEEMDKMSYFDRESQEAKNEEILRSIEFLRTTELDEMYFEWFYSRNGRYMMDSNTLNPQTDKLHRFAIVPENHKVDLDIGSKDRSKNTAEQNEHRDLFLTALAQATNMSTDKKSTEEVLAYGEKMLELGSKGLMQKLKDDMVNGKKAEHISHYIQAIEAVKAYEANGKSGEFTTYLSMESDAVTSGFGLKLLQLPILGKKGEDGADLDTVKEWARKTGIFIGESVESMNDMVSFSDFFDSYETLAKEVTPEMAKDANNYSMKGKYDPWKAVTKYDKLINHEIFIDVLPKPKEDGEVSKELRTLFKDPFMTFNYSRSVSSIQNGLGVIIADDIIRRLVGATEEKPLSTADKALLRKLEHVYGKEVGGKTLVQRLQEQAPTQIKPLKGIDMKDDIHTYLANMGKATYGEMVGNAMNENFKAFNEANEVINKAFVDMFEVYQTEYEAKVAKIEGKNNRGITKKEKLEIIQSLRGKFPLIKGPYSEDIETYSDAIAIYDDDNMTAKELEESYGTVSTKLANKVDVKVQSKIRKLKHAIKAGSVIPIHYIDAAVIGNTILDHEGVLGIHDAIIPNLLSTKEVVHDYNRNTIEVNRDYSVVRSIIESYKRVIEENGTEEQKTTLQELQSLYDTAQANRDAIFNSQIDVVHMSAVPGSKYVHNSEGSSTIKPKYTKAQIDAVKAIIMGPNTNTLKPAFRALMKKYNIDMKDC